MTDNYLTILEDSLHQKIALLHDIEACNGRQDVLLKEETFDPEAFDEIVNEKDEIVDRITRLDDGFLALYDKVREQLQAGRTAHEEQIERIQKLISEITDRVTSIRASEERMKLSVERKLAGMRKEIGQRRKSSQGAYDYYRNISALSAVSSHIMDQKN